MARNLPDWTTAYSPATDDYPTGSAKDASSSEATDGTPYTKEILNGLIGVQQAILRNAGFDLEQGISHKPENVNESDILKALLKIIGRDAGSLVSSEKTERQNADNVLQGNINNEAESRKVHGFQVGDIVTTLNIHRYDGVWLSCFGQKLLASDFPELYEKCCGEDNCNGLKTVWEEGKEFIVLPDLNDRALVFFHPWNSLGDYFDEQLPNITGMANARAWTRQGGNWNNPFDKSYAGAFKWEVAKLPEENYEMAEYDSDRSGNIGLTFDASRCSSVYGRRDKWGSEAVRMKSFSVMAFIKVK